MGSALEELRLKWPYFILKPYNILYMGTSSPHIDGLVQERCNSIGNALELRLSCTNQSIWSHEPTLVLEAVGIWRDGEYDIWGAREGWGGLSDVDGGRGGYWSVLNEGRVGRSVGVGDHLAQQFR